VWFVVEDVFGVGVDCCVDLFVDECVYVWLVCAVGGYVPVGFEYLVDFYVGWDEFVFCFIVEYLVDVLWFDLYD